MAVEKKVETVAYAFSKLPDNIRQVGEQPEGKRVYIEDYVVTYIHKIFQKEREDAIVVLVGKEGEKQAANTIFVYGAVMAKADILEGENAITKEIWEKIFQDIGKYFPGGQVCGWGCGVSMWTSQIDKSVKKLQDKYFARENAVIFLEDLGEKEEKVFLWKEGQMNGLSGYTIYYGKNPMMQEYVLAGKPKKSFEATYTDKVTQTVRSVIKKKEEEKEIKRNLLYSAGAVLVLLTVVGVSMLIQSTRKIESLEQTIETLSTSGNHITVTSSPKKEEEKEGRITIGKKERNKEIAEKVTKEKSKPKQKESTKTTANKEKAKTMEKKKQRKTVLKGTKEKKQSSPNKETKPVKKRKESRKKAVSKANASYVVRAGDTLSQIVWRQYHSMECVAMVKKANGIKNSDKIKEGQRILLPSYNP